MFWGACVNSSICFSGIGPVVVFVMYLWKCFKIKQITSNIFAAFFNAITSFLLFSCTSKMKGSIVCGNENICKWMSEGGYKCQSEATVDKLLYFMLLHPRSFSMTRSEIEHRLVEAKIIQLGSDANGQTWDYEANLGYFENNFHILGLELLLWHL